MVLSLTSARGAWLGIASALALIVVPAAARAESGDDAKDEASEGAKDEASDEKADDDGEEKSGKSDDTAAKTEKSDDDDGDFGHMGQFGIRAGLVGGYRMVLRYDTSPYCAPPELNKQHKDQRKFCGHGAPFALDLGLSFALLDFFEPFAWARIGLGVEAQTDTKNVLILGVGARLYMTSADVVKVFIEPAVAYEFEGGRGTPAWQHPDIKYDNDLVFHLAAGPQIDFHKNVGVFLTAGVTTGVLRALHNSLDLAGGVQGRFP
jgi:hypothetical protein